MKLNIKIQTGENCGFVIQDITCGESGYLPEDSITSEVNQFKYLDTLSIIAITRNTTKEEINGATLFSQHQLQGDSIYVPTQFDGWFTINYIVIPTQEWFLKSQDQLQKYNTVYYSDGTNIYKYFNNETSIVEVEELIERNEEGTTISRVSEDLVSICFLKKCFINICKQILDLRGFSKCKTTGDVDDNIIFNRDLVWMTMNIISYLTEFGQLAEAQRLIEQFEENCNGICKSYNRTTNSNGCGCS